MPTLHLFVSGRVQGVFFRQSTRDKASQLGLSGWVKNLSDGRVEIEASGTLESLKQLLEWAANGPPHAIVNEIQSEWLDNQTDTNRHHGGFHIT